MGSYASFSIDSYQLLSSKSVVNAVVMMVFTEAEKRIRQEKFSESFETFPQVFHRRLWKEKTNLYKRLGAFAHFHTAYYYYYFLIRFSKALVIAKGNG